MLTPSGTYCDEHVMTCQVSEVRVVHKGSGYASTLPVKVTIDPPPPKVSDRISSTSLVREVAYTREADVLRIVPHPETAC